MLLKKTFPLLALINLLFRSTNNTDALKHLVAVFSRSLFDVFRFRKSLAFNTVKFFHLLNGY